MSSRCITLQFLLSFLFFINLANGQSVADYSSLIDSDLLKRHLTVLSSDSLEGRETSTKGMQLAADYVSDQFQQMGLKAPNGNYLQPVHFVYTDSTSFRFTIRGEELTFGKDYFFQPYNSELSYALREGNLMMVSPLSNIEKLDLKDKSVMIITEAFKTMSEDSLSDTVSVTLKKIQKQGVRAVFIQRNIGDEKYARQIKRMMAPRLTLPTEDDANLSAPVVSVSDDVISKLTRKKTKQLLSQLLKSDGSALLNEKVSADLMVDPSYRNCNNVAAYLEGTDLKDEIVVISSHLDHLGKRGGLIYHGADDDGSGSASVLNLAAAFTEAARQGKGPRRSILFITFTGEEKGLLGSDYYTRHPLFPISNTVCDLNIDMIGRVDTVSRENNRYVYIIGSDKMSTELHQINERSNDTCCGLKLDYTYNDESHPMRLYYRSDHYNFVKRGVPVIFYFSGLHSDYHQPTDTVDKIDFKKMVPIVQLVFNTAWSVANADHRVQVDRK